MNSSNNITYINPLSELVDFVSWRNQLTMDELVEKMSTLSINWTENEIRLIIKNNKISAGRKLLILECIAFDRNTIYKWSIWILIDYFFKEAILMADIKIENPIVSQSWIDRNNNRLRWNMSDEWWDEYSSWILQSFGINKSSFVRNSERKSVSAILDGSIDTHIIYASRLMVMGKLLQFSRLQMIHIATLARLWNDGCMNHLAKYIKNNHAWSQELYDILRSLWLKYDNYRDISSSDVIELVAAKPFENKEMTEST
jgi:hypothetical protein